MLKTLDEFLDKICQGLKKRGLSKGAIDFHMARLTEVYEKSPIFGELEIDDYNDYQEEEFCDGVSLPIKPEEVNTNNPFIIMNQTHNEQVEKRIHQLSEYYDKVQESRGEVWFPPEEEEIVEAINVQGMFGRTLLIQAVIDGDLDEVNRIIKKGADIGIKDSSGNDALQSAILNGYDDIADRLREEMSRSPFG